jgi:hypothetical protein
LAREEQLQQRAVSHVGAGALDEEDRAHLEALQREQERSADQCIEMQMEDEVALF